MSIQQTGKWKLVIFSLVAVLLSSVCSVGAIFVIDLYLHKRFGSDGWLNIWGYGGPVVKRKQPGEQRIVVLGGSTAFGYGVRQDESFPAYLERQINERLHRSDHKSVSVVNLAYNNEGAYSFKYTLQDYRYLNYDIVILCEGYNDLGYNTSVFRHQSPIFKLTGYLPIFPWIFRQKAIAIRYGGDLDAAYGRKKTTFKPNLAGRATATVLEQAASISRSLEHQLGRLTSKPEQEVVSTTKGCYEPWIHYCQGVAAAINYSLSQGA